MTTFTFWVELDSDKVALNVTIPCLWSPLAVHCMFMHLSVWISLSGP